MPLTVLVAPNAFKGSLDAIEISEIIQSGLAGLGVEIKTLPMGDGGDGTARILASYMQASPLEFVAYDALNRRCISHYYVHDDTAIIELATICGIKNLKTTEYNVLETNTFGVGMAVNHAITNGIHNILLCVGGSASIDGGIGALEAMGLNVSRRSSIHNNHLIDIEHIETSDLIKKFKDVHITILCDVDNALNGPLGAARIFGPQKGASPDQVKMLDEYLIKWSEILSAYTSQDIGNIKHGGAAGGIAAAFAALLNANLISGSHYCLELSGFDALLPHSFCVITGEGKIDNQSLFGKIPGVIARKCQEKQIRVIGVCGQAPSDIKVFDRIFALTDYAPCAEAAIQEPEKYLYELCGDLREYLCSNL